MRRNFGGSSCQESAKAEGEKFIRSYDFASRNWDSQHIFIGGTNVENGGGGVAVSHTTRYAGPERRDTSPEGVARRARFQASLKLLSELGLSPKALEYYKRLARTNRALPHELVRAMAEKLATPETVVIGKMGLDPTRPN